MHFYLKKDKILQKSTLVFDFYDHMGIYTGSTIIFLKNIMSKKLKNKGAVSVRGGYLYGTGVIESSQNMCMGGYVTFKKNGSFMLAQKEKLNIVPKQSEGSAPSRGNRRSYSTCLPAKSPTFFTAVCTPKMLRLDP